MKASERRANEREKEAMVECRGGNWRLVRGGQMREREKEATVECRRGGRS